VNILVPEIKRKTKESFESALRRFNKQVQQSGKLLSVRKLRFFTRSKNRRAKKETALRRMKIEQKKNYLRKVGKLKDIFPGVKAVMRLQ